MFAFLKKLVGMDDEAAEAEQQFQKNLAQLKANSEKLNAVTGQLAKISSRVENKTQQLRKMAGTSGQHVFNLPPGAHVRESKPSF